MVISFIGGDRDLCGESFNGVCEGEGSREGRRLEGKGEGILYYVSEILGQKGRRSMRGLMGR